MANARKNYKELTAVAAARETIKSFSPAILGKGRKNGGGVQFQKARAEVLERVRAIAPLPGEQHTDWNIFKTNWDQAMAREHGENLADMFAEWMQSVVAELMAGITEAFSEFMHRKTQRVLSKLQVLVILGVLT